MRFRCKERPRARKSKEANDLRYVKGVGMGEAGRHAVAARDDESSALGVVELTAVG